MNGILNAGIGFVGAGKVGVTLGSYFVSKGLKVKGYASANPKSADAAAVTTGTQAFPCMRSLVAECGIIFITTPDDQIEKVWNEIKKHDVNGRIIGHTSGAKASDLFTGISARGASGYSIHPMHAFADRNGKFDGLETAWFTIEGDGARLDQVRNLLTALGNNVLVINSKNKTRYHLANVMVSNLVLAMLNIGCNLMTACGIDEESALKSLMPLIMNNIENISEKGFLPSLTGPIERNDLGTVLKHREVLNGEHREIYRELSLELIKLAVKKHPERDYAELTRFLESHSPWQPLGHLKE